MTRRKFEDLTNRTFNMWTVLEQREGDSRDPWRWLCQCECGNKKVVRSSNLLAGLSKSCGCQRNNSRKREKLKRDTFYDTLWKNWEDNKPKGP